MGDEFSNEVESWQGDIDFAFVLMILIPEGDNVIDKGSDSSLGYGGSFGVSANVLDNFFSIGQFFPDVDVPLFCR